MESVKLNKTKRSIKSSFFGIIYKLIGIIFPFVIRTIIIKKLGSEYLGLSSLFTSILQILSLSELGIGSAMVFHLYKPVNDGDYELVSKYMNFYKFIYRIIGVTIFISGLIVMPFLHLLVKGDIPTDINLYILFAIYLSNTIISYLFFSYRTTLLNVYQRNDLVSIAGTISNIVLFGIQIFVLIAFKNYYIYILFLPICTLMNNLLVYLFSRKYYSNLLIYDKVTLDNEKKKSIFKNTGALFGHKFGAVLICSMDNIVISSLLGLVPLAVFNNYYYVVTAINGFLDIIMIALLFGIGNYIINNNSDNNYKLFRVLNYIQFMLVGFCSICMLCLYQDFIQLWVGKENMYKSFLIVILFVVYFYSWKSRGMLLTFKDAAGMWKNDFLKPYIGVIINIVLDFILVYFIGAEGALISTIIIFVFIYFPWEVYVLFKDMFKCSPKNFIISVFYYIIVTIVICIGLYFISKSIESSSILIFIFKALLVAFLAGVTLIISTFWTKEFRYVLKKFLKR